MTAKTPFLDTDYGHLFDCKYCVSVWFGFIVVLFATFLDCEATRLMAVMIVVGRVSNYAHIIISTVKDYQLNLRLSR